jgi:endoglycosylceramidase
MKAEKRIPLAILLIIIGGLGVFLIVMDGSSSDSNIGYNGGLTFANRGFLKSEGTRIVDKSGNDLLLRGANFFGYEVTGYGSLFRDAHVEADYQRMASWGFNVVRLPIAWNFIEPQPNIYDDSYLANYVDRDIAWAKRYGIYIIIDMHQTYWSPHFTYYEGTPGNGLPSWAVSGYPNTSEGEARSKADFWGGKAPNGTSPSDNNPSMIDRFMQMWKHVATRYNNEATVAAYDLFNEPWINSVDGKAGYYDIDKFCTVALPAFYERVVDGIRTVDTHHMILWEPAAHPVCSKITQRLDRPNVAYSPHYPGGLGGYDGDKTGLSNAVGAIVRFANDSGQPVFIGEWGISDDETSAAQYIRDLGDIMHNNGLGWAWWTYGRTSFEMGLIDEHGAERSILVTNLLWVLNQQ